MRLLLVAGGSGGHLAPALALAEHLRGVDECMILSTRRPAERAFGAGGSLWVSVELEKFTPLWRWLRPRFAFRQMAAVREVWRLLRHWRPDVVIGFGGYLSAVGVVVARAMSLPAVVHEQNVLPGRANRWVLGFSRAAAVSFPKTRTYLRKGRWVEVTGNPVRSALVGIGWEAARQSFGFDLERPLLLVIGGSQGSQVLNTLVVEMLRRQPPAVRARMQLLHLAGPGRAASVLEAYRPLGMDVQVFDFLREIERGFAAATLAVSRAGATTIAELAAARLPAVLVPYPHADRHQRANADWMQAAGAAVVLEERGLSPQALWDEVSPLLWDPARLSRMRAALAAGSNGLAAQRLGNLVRRVASSCARTP